MCSEDSIILNIINSIREHDINNLNIMLESYTLNTYEREVVISLAMKMKSIPILEWILNCGMLEGDGYFTSIDLHNIIEEGNLEVLQWSFNKGLIKYDTRDGSFRISHIRNAYRLGYLHISEWIIHHVIPYNEVVNYALSISQSDPKFYNYLQSQIGG